MEIPDLDLSRFFVCSSLFGGANGRLAADMLSRTNTGASPESEVSDRDIPADGAMPSGRIIVEIPVQMTAPITVPSGKNNMDITMLDMGAFVWMAGGTLFYIEA